MRPKNQKLFRRSIVIVVIIVAIISISIFSYQQIPGKEKEKEGEITYFSTLEANNIINAVFQPSTPQGTHVISYLEQDLFLDFLYIANYKYGSLYIDEIFLILIENNVIDESMQLESILYFKNANITLSNGVLTNCLFYSNNIRPIGEPVIWFLDYNAINLEYLEILEISVVIV